MVVAVVVVFLLVGHSSPSKSGLPSPDVNPLAPASVLSAVTGVSPTVSSTIGAGGVTDPLQPLSGSPAQLTGPNGHPELFYLGAEFCPYCAAERWSVVIALSRFGSFSNLRTTMSDSNPDDIPNTHTFTFYGSSYSSQYLDFAPDRERGPQQQPPADADGRAAGADQFLRHLAVLVHHRRHPLPGPRQPLHPERRGT